MRIASFVRDGGWDCGLVDSQDRVHLLDGVPVLAGIAPAQRLYHLLGLSAEQRRVLAASIDLNALPIWAGRELGAAVPRSPLYLLAHGNSPTIWKRQSGPATRWEMPRVTMFRIRPWTSFVGHEYEKSIPVGAGLAGGNELGVVIGKDAWQVPEEQAADHIAGVVALNDFMLRGPLPEAPDVDRNKASHYRMSMDCLGKAADGNGAIGPWITTIEELEDRCVELVGRGPVEAMRKNGRALAGIYHLLQYSLIDGKTVDRCYSAAINHGAEYLIAYFSRFMTLKAGTILGLGASGWDGVGYPLEPEAGKRMVIDVRTEHVGTMRINAVRTAAQAAPASPFLQYCQHLGLPAEADQLQPPSRQIWVSRGNYKEAAKLEGIPANCPYNCLMYPSTTLGQAQEPLVFQPAMTDIEIELHMAAVIGRPSYHLEEDQVLSSLRGVALMIHARDLSLGQWLNDPTDYEARSAFFLGGSADGFIRLGPLQTIRSWDELASRKMVLQAGNQQVQTSSADYLRGLTGLAVTCSRMSTLLPGDILSLGPAGQPLVLRADENCSQRQLVAQVDGLGSAAWNIRDLRDLKCQSDNSHRLHPQITTRPPVAWPRKWR